MPGLRNGRGCIARGCDSGILGRPPTRAMTVCMRQEQLMRPALLNPLFAPVTSLSGVGPKQDKLFRYLLGRDDTPRLADLLLHLPSNVIDRRARPKMRDAVPGSIVTLEVTVDQ